MCGDKHDFKSYQIYLKSSNYSFIFGRLNLNVIYVLTAQSKQAQNSKQSEKGYERIIQEILRRSGYFSNFFTFLREVVGFTIYVVIVSPLMLLTYLVS